MNQICQESENNLGPKSNVQEARTEDEGTRVKKQGPKNHVPAPSGAEDLMPRDSMTPHTRGAGCKTEWPKHI